MLGVNEMTLIGIVLLVFIALVIAIIRFLIKFLKNKSD